MKLRPAVRLLAGLVLGAVARPSPVAGLTLQPVATGLDHITTITHAGDGSGRLFIALQDGRIMVHDAGGVRSTPLLDIRSLVANGLETGLLGLAFPKTGSGNRFYVHYVDHDLNVVIATYSMSGNPNVANPSGQIVLKVPQPPGSKTHKGGQLQFGPDGYLYIGLGDGGRQWDPDDNGQNLGTLLGKILRIDVSGGGAGYSIPPSNPFSNLGGRKEIWAYGLRNPWRFSFDRATGDMFIGDVGESRREEIDFQPFLLGGGQNYGWRRMEGSLCFNPTSGCQQGSGMTLPVMEYDHSEFGRFIGCSVTGGYRYRGASIPSLQGAYLFADFCRGRVWAGEPNGANVWSFAPVLDSTYLISTFGEDEAGEIYLADSREGGGVYKIVPGTPSLSVSDAKVVEGNSGTRDAVFTVRLLPASPSTVRVSYSTSDGLAVAGEDYASTTGILTFLPGVNSLTLTVPIQGDSTYEPDEDFSVSLSNAVNATIVAGSGTGTATITNDDSGLVVSDVTVAEGDAGQHDAIFIVSRVGVPSSPATVDYATTDGTAFAGVDYVATDGTLQFSAGQTIRTFAVPILGDILVEPSPKVFNVSLSNAMGASITDGVGTGSITDDDLGPGIAVDDVAVAEGDSGTTEAIFTVSLSYASQQLVTVLLKTSPNTASGTGSAAPDYQDTSVPLSFPPGLTTQTVSVTVQGDTLSEDDETFLASLTGATNGHITRQGIGTILDNDPFPTVSVGPATVTEGDSGKLNAVFPLTLDVPSGRLISVPYATSAGTASEGPEPPALSSAENFLLITGKAQSYPWTINVPAFSGNVRKVAVKISLPYCLFPGPNGEPSFLEFFDMLLVGPQGQRVVLMSDAPGVLTAAPALLTFDDDGPALPAGPIVSGTYRPTNYDRGGPDIFDPPAPGLPFGTGLSVFKGLSPVGTWSLFVMGDEPTVTGWGCAATWALDLETDADYSGTVGTAVFPRGVTEWSVAVPVLGDHTLEPDETFNFDLGAPTHATVAVGHAVGTILNDDELELRVGDVTVAEGDSGTKDAVLTVTLDQPGTGPVTLDYSTVNGSATDADGDFVASNGTLTFEPGVTVGTIAVPVVGDLWHEPDETFSVVLSSPSGAEIVRGTAVVSLPNNDPLPTISVADVVAAEGGGLSFEVLLSAPSREPVSVSYATGDGTARSGLDYLPGAGVLVFPAEARMQPVTVPTLTDLVTEPSESVRLNLSAPAFAEIARSPATGWILDPKTEPRVQFSAPRYTVSEGARRALIAVRRTGDVRQPMSVDYAATDGTAQAGTAYTPVSGTLAFGPGVVTKAFAVPILDDSVVDGPSTVLLSLGEIGGPAVLGAPDTAVLTIVDDDVAGQVRFSKPQYSVNEAGGAATITVVRERGLAGEVRIDYTTSDETATGGIDYQPTSGTLTFGPRATKQTFTVPVLVDDQAEGSEKLTLSLSNPGGGATLGAPAAATLAIGDAQPTIEFASATFTAPESAPRATVTVVRSGPTTGAATVGYSTSDGTAVQGVDYLPASGTLAFGPGQGSKTFSVTLLNDRLLQVSSTILLNLSNPQGSVLGAQASAVVSIQDDDKAGIVQFGAPSYRVTDRAAAVQIMVTRSGGMAEGVSVDYATADGTAVAGTHYASTSGRLHFGAGVTRQSILVPILHPATPQGDETVLLSLTNPTGRASLGGRSNAILTIASTDPILQFGAAAYRAGPGAPSATIVVVRSGPLDGTVTADYATADGSATAGEDYASTSGTLVFGPGAMVRTFTVPLLGNPGLESDETVELQLSGPSGGAALGARSAAVLTIATDDPVLQWAKAELRVSERAAAANLVVRRVGPPTGTASAQFTTSDVSAQSGSDYLATSGTVTFAPGVVSQAVRVPIVNDTPDEALESFQVTLSDPGASTLLGTPNVVTVTIDDNDVAGTIQLGAADFSAREAEGLATVTVVRTGGSAGEAAVDFATGGGTAQAGTHYEATSGTLVFGPGEASKTFSVPIHAGTGGSVNLFIGLTLANPGGGATLGTRTTGRLWLVGS